MRHHAVLSMPSAKLAVFLAPPSVISRSSCVPPHGEEQNSLMDAPLTLYKSIQINQQTRDFRTHPFWRVSRRSTIHADSQHSLAFCPGPRLRGKTSARAPAGNPVPPLRRLLKLPSWKDPGSAEKPSLAERQRRKGGCILRGPAWNFLREA